MQRDHQLADAIATLIRLSVDLDVRFTPGRAEVVEFDPASDIALIDQALIELDQKLDAGGENDGFLKLSTDRVDSDQTAAEELLNLATHGLAGEAGLAFYYDAADDTVNIMLIAELDGRDQDDDTSGLEADIVLEFDVDGCAEGDALIGALPTANFEIAPLGDMDFI